MHAPLVRLFAPAALVLALAGCTIELHHDLTEQDANEIYVLLTENGISAGKERQEGGNEPRYMISVPKADASQAAKLLREYSLPRPDPAGFKTIRINKGMIPTEIEQRAMMLEAVGGEVSAALNKVDGVLEARTIVMIPEKNDLAQPDQKPVPSASVFIKYRDTTDGKPPLEEQNVRRFVSTAVENLKPEAVTVIMSQATPSEALRDEGEHLVYVLGFQMAKGSASSFKSMVAVLGLVMLAMAALTTWTFLRTGSGPKPRRS